MRALLKRLLRPPLKAPVRPGPYVLAQNDFGTFCLPRKALHRPACQAVLRGSVYERETIRFLVENATGDIIHGGTFFGDFLPALSRSYEHVWAFEPNADSFRCAEVTASLNGLQNVTLTNAGMSSGEGRKALCTERDGQYLGGASYFVDEPGDTPVVAIDKAIPRDRPIGVIQLDVEGHEQQALEGARETIARWKPVILLETPVPLITELGYRESGRLNGNTIFRS